MDADASGTIYVSEDFRRQLDKDSIQDMVEFYGQSYRIIGTFKALHKESSNGHTIGSVFYPGNQLNAICFKMAPGTDIKLAIRRINEICRHYVPVTLPVEIKKLPDDKQDFMRSIQMMQGAMMILAIVSILLVVLSIYSAISMDTISRQKEMAIRKINGATPTTIATVFGKAYLTIFLLAFAVAYPLLRLAMMAIIDNMKVVSEWWWGVVLFFSVAFMIFLTTAYKIYRIMHINPAEIIKNE